MRYHFESQSPRGFWALLASLAGALLIWAFWICVIGGVIYLLLHPIIIGEWIGAIKAGMNH